MRIKINIQIFAIIAIFIITKQIEIYAYLMLFALIHELAHMLAGLLLKMKPKALEISGFGISIVFEGYNNIQKNKILIPIAGPAFNFLIAFIFQFIHIKTQQVIVNSNLLLAIGNLIPIYPLDGGRILKLFIRKYKTSEETEFVTNRISNVLMILLTIIASILIMLYKNIGILLIIAYLWILVINENKKYNLKQRIYKILDQNFSKST